MGCRAQPRPSVALRMTREKRSSMPVCAQSHQHPARHEAAGHRSKSSRARGLDEQMMLSRAAAAALTSSASRICRGRDSPRTRRFTPQWSPPRLACVDLLSTRSVRGRWAWGRGASTRLCRSIALSELLIKPIDGSCEFGDCVVELRDVRRCRWRCCRLWRCRCCRWCCHCRWCRYRCWRPGRLLRRQGWSHPCPRYRPP
jgi:hypothetical protein